MSLSIQGKTAIVTGAAHGLGLAIARHFLDRGANVMVADIDEAALEAEWGDGARAEGALRLRGGDLCKKLAITNLLSATMEAGFDLHAIPAVLLGGGASVVSRHLSPKDGLCKTIFLLDDKVNAVGFERALTAVSRRKSEV